MLDYANTPETLRHIAADCEAAALVTYDHQWAAVSGLLDELPSLRLAICVGAKVVPEVRVLSFAAIQQDYPPDAKPADRIPDDLAYLIYTSGSTGKSKGVMVTHRCALLPAPIRLSIWDYRRLIFTPAHCPSLLVQG